MCVCGGSSKNLCLVLTGTATELQLRVVCVCACVYSFVHVLVGTCAGFCGERRFMLAVFLSCSPSCVLRKGLTQPGSH